MLYSSECILCTKFIMILISFDRKTAGMKIHQQGHIMHSVTFTIVTYNSIPINFEIKLNDTL